MHLSTTNSAAGLLIGYARVSTDEQRLDHQLDALEAAGVLRRNVFVEKVSGASRKRPALDRCRKALRQGDTLVVTSLDRLSRNLGWTILFMDDLNRNGIIFRSLTQSIDTGTAQGRLMMHLLGAFAEFEREMIRTRTTAGVRARMARGGKVGRQLQVDLVEAERLIKSGLTLTEVTRKMGLKRRSVLAYHFSAEDVARLQMPPPVKPKPKRPPVKPKRKR